MHFVRIKIIALIGLAGIPGAVFACPSAGEEATFLYDFVPPNGEVVAEVEILDNASPSGRVAIDSRIVRMLRGPHKANAMTIRPDYVSSCDIIPVKGQHGIIAGRVLAQSGERLIIEPIRPPSRAQLEFERERERHGRTDAQMLDDLLARPKPRK